MRERGLEPDFPRDVMAEVDALRGPATDPAARDLRAPAVVLDRQRRLAATSTSSRSRSACRTARPDSGRDRRRRRAGEEGHRDRSPRRAEHHLGLHRREDLPDAAGAPLDRPDVAGPGRGSARGGGRAGGRAPTGRWTDPTSTARPCATTPSSPTTPSRHGSTVTAPAPAPLAAVPGLEENLRWQDAAAQQLRARATRAGRARSRDDRGARGLRRRGDPRASSSRSRTAPAS